MGLFSRLYLVTQRSHLIVSLRQREPWKAGGQGDGGSTRPWLSLPTVPSLCPCARLLGEASRAAVGFPHPLPLARRVAALRSLSISSGWQEAPYKSINEFQADAHKLFGLEAGPFSVVAVKPDSLR